MLATALESSDPVIIFEYTSLLNTQSEIPLNSGPVDIDKAKIRRAGKDLSIITYGPGVYKALAAAKELASSGIDVEVLDLRVLNPIDNETIMDSVAKTHRVLVVEEAWRSVSISSEIISRIMEHSFYELDMPIQRLCGIEVPIPYAKHMEDASIPQQQDIVDTILKMMQHDRV
nr:transketolase C-terminal domain-containing protein [Maribacter sp. Hal144]